MSHRSCPNLPTTHSRLHTKDGDTKPPCFKEDMAEEKWIEDSNTVCYHCGTRMDQDAEGQYTCGGCHKVCVVCGFGPLPGFRRYGSPRPFEGINNVRFVRERHKGYRLELRDLNGIQRGPWLRKISEWSRAGQIFADCMIIARQFPQFPLYSPVKTQLPQNSEDVFIAPLR